MSPRWPIALACALASLCLGVMSATIASAPYGHRVSALVHMSPADGVSTLARASDPGFALVPPGSHYDGSYFYAIARDPLAIGRAHGLIDEAPYRYGHAGLGLLAYLVALGRAPAIPLALLTINLLALAAAAWCASRLATGLGRTGWAGLLVAASPGLLYAVANDTSEPLSAALLGAGLLAWQRGRPLLAALAFLPMCLTKEPLVLVPVAIGLWHAVSLLRARQLSRAAVRQLGSLAVGPVVFAGWVFYLQNRFGASPIDHGQGRLTRPLHGFLDSLRLAAQMVNGDTNASQLAGIAMPLLLATAGALLVGCVVALRLRTVIDLAYLASAGLALCLSFFALLYPKDLIRTTVIPMLLLPAVLATRRSVPPA
ncbi:MAG: hypothetical protein M3N21_06575 [Actinomycetota bacterium]|nr:hypothetical protein [Actinomycetota bacterium]